MRKETQKTSAAASCELVLAVLWVNFKICMKYALWLDSYIIEPLIHPLVQLKISIKIFKKNVLTFGNKCCKQPHDSLPFLLFPFSFFPFFNFSKIENFKLK